MIFGHDQLPSKVFVSFLSFSLIMFAFQITHYLLRGTILVTEISVVVFGLFISKSIITNGMEVWLHICTVTPKCMLNMWIPFLLHVGVAMNIFLTKLL